MSCIYTIPFDCITVVKYTGLMRAKFALINVPFNLYPRLLIDIL